MKEVASRYLFVDLAIKNLELDFQHVMAGSFKIKDPYISIISKAISKAKNERRELKKIMYDEKISVVFSHKEGNFSHYKFILNGKEDKVSYFNPVIKKNVEEIMKELFEGN